MSKKHTASRTVHITNLKLIAGTISLVLFAVCIYFIFYFIENGGYEILVKMQNS